MNTRLLRSTATLLVALLTAATGWAVSLGQIDTFEDGTTQGWTVNLLGLDSNPAPPVNALGGPAGATDNYLRLTSLGGSGAGSRLSVLNGSQWTGNYIAAGIGFISMDLINLGQTDLAIRLAFEDPLGGPPTNIDFSRNAFLLPTGTGWTNATFAIGLSDLQAALGNIGSALSNTTTLRLYHSDAANVPNPSLPIPAISAQLGIDNIEALSSPSSRVPESGSTVALLLPLLVTAVLMGRRFRAFQSSHS